MEDNLIWIAVIVGTLGTFMWRVLGVVIETRIPQDSPLFIWIGCVAYAMVAGLMARVLFMPAGEVSLDVMSPRLGAFLIGLGVWYGCGKSVPAGLFAGVLTYGGFIWLGIV